MSLFFLHFTQPVGLCKGKQKKSNGMLSASFFCQSTGAMHVELMVDYSTAAFLVQWGRFTALQGKPCVIVSDKGSQLTSKENEARMDWEQVARHDAASKVRWDFVPTGCQFQNRLCERRVQAVKRT